MFALCHSRDAIPASFVGEVLIFFFFFSGVVCVLDVLLSLYLFVSCLVLYSFFLSFFFLSLVKYVSSLNRCCIYNSTVMNYI